MSRGSSWLGQECAPRWALGGALALVAFGVGVETARAEQCSNPCEVGDGDVCAPIKQVIEVGQSLTMRPGRQSGACGGVVPLDADQVVLTWSRDPAGPFTPIPATRRGRDLVVKPDRAGPYFVKVAARDGVGTPDRLVIMVVEPRNEPVRLQLRPGKGLAAARTAIKVRWVPTTASDGFPRHRWPVWRDNDRAGLAGNPLRLPPGRYDVEWTDRWRGHARTGVTTIDVAGQGTIAVELTPAVPSSPSPSPSPSSSSLSPSSPSSSSPSPSQGPSCPAPQSPSSPR